MERTILASVLLATMVIVGLVIAVIVIKVCNTNGKFKTDYDERQKVMIGKSYKYAMITAWALMALYMVIDMGGNKLPMENSLVIFTIIVVSVMVHTSYSVWKDAYFGINNNNKRYAIASVVITAVNLAATAGYIKEGRFIVDGVITSGAVSLECALMFLILGVEFWIKGIADKKKKSEEDDDNEES